MTVQAGTVNAVSLATGSPAGNSHTISSVTYIRKSYLVTVSFPAYTGSSDSGQITGLGAAITAAVRDGRTRTLRADAAPTCVAPGLDSNGQDVFIGVCTVSVDNVTFNLTAGEGTELATSTATTTDVQLVVPVDETPT